MAPSSVVSAAFRTFMLFNRCGSLDAEVRNQMCKYLTCTSHELDAALTPVVVDEIMGVVRCANL